MATSTFTSTILLLTLAFIAFIASTTAHPSVDLAARKSPKDCTCFTASTTIPALTCPSVLTSTSCSIVLPCALPATFVPPHVKKCPTTPTTTFYSSTCPSAVSCPYCPDTTATFTSCLASVTTVSQQGCSTPTGCTYENCIVLSTVTKLQETCGCVGKRRETVTETISCSTGCPPLACATVYTTVTAGDTTATTSHTTTPASYPTVTPSPSR